MKYVATILSLAMLVGGPMASGAILIDDFDTGQGPLILTAVGEIGMTIGSTQDGGDILGGERDLQVTLLGGGQDLNIVALASTGNYSHSASASVTGYSTLYWDGDDNDETTINYTGLGGLDLTEGGLQDALAVRLISADPGAALVIDVYSDATNWSRYNLPIPSGALNYTYILPFAGFAIGGGAGADFANVGAVAITVDGSSTQAVDVNFDTFETAATLSALKVDALFDDVDGNTWVNFGDTVRYTATITNDDDDGDAPSGTVIFTDTPPNPGTALDVGSVTTSQGTVLSGNGAGDTDVEVLIGAIADNTTVTITWDVLITVGGEPEICNQGFLNGDRPTDDPDVGGTQDATCTTIAFCGDGIVNQVSEACDDGNANNHDDCLDTCIVATCGDGFLHNEESGTEECDDANANNHDDCIDNCQLAECGDGYLHNEQSGTEECDDANANNNDDCIDDCQIAECGDGYVHDEGAGTEACDDGNASNFDACLNTCVEAECGDGFPYTEGEDADEECDDGNTNNHDDCRDDCGWAYCGDGFVHNQGTGTEECDDANANNHDDCLDNCELPECGDGILHNEGTGTEECDDANTNNHDDCLDNCEVAECGDGILHNEGAGTEECDDANSDNTDACLNTCENAECGDGFVWAGEELCDDGNLINTDDCLDTCVPASCGDGIVWAGVEECDDANLIDTDACIDCEDAECGDGIVWAGVEECDDGNLDNTDACISCENAECGDGYVWVGEEECDDGDLIDTNDCTNECEAPFCGDGIVWVGHEECDEIGNHPTCDADCTIPECGDGWRNPFVGEECDDGNLDNGDGCSAICLLEDPDLLPTVSHWGMLALSLSLMVGVAITFGRRRAA